MKSTTDLPRDTYAARMTASDKYNGRDLTVAATLGDQIAVGLCATSISPAASTFLTPTEARELAAFLIAASDDVDNA